jgi:hypothetical protein
VIDTDVEEREGVLIVRQQAPGDEFPGDFFVSMMMVS